MKSQKLGKNTLSVEVLNVSRNGIWLLVDDVEYFLSYADFPWFKTATVPQIFAVKRPSSDHLHWPDLDVELEVQSLADLDKYPLVYSE